MTDTESILLAEKNCETETNDAFKEIIEFNDELFFFYLKISEKYCKERTKTYIERPIAIFFINHRIVNSLYCISDLLKRGYYIEGLSLQRDVLEAVSLTEYMLKNPQVSKLWLAGEQIPFSKVNKEISPVPYSGEIYGLLCDFTHSNRRSSIIESDINIPGMEVFLSFEPFFQRKISGSSLIHQIILTHRAMTNYLNFIKEFCSEIDKEDSEKIKTINEKLPIIEKFLVEILTSE
jgi:hypothetical protein